MVSTDSDEQSLNFNFWPAFADLMLSLILILLLVIGGTYFSSIDFHAIEEKQKDLAASLCLPGRIKKEAGNSVEIHDASGRLLYRLSQDPDDPMLQIVSFSEDLLFASGDEHLKPSGAGALIEVGKLLIQRLDHIVEIQIRGHADTVATKRHRDNLELASLRANEVFRFFQNRVGIDPAAHFMSASSFAEFVPVQRRRDSRFDTGRLQESNLSDADKQMNRRIELVLFYRRPGGAERKPESPRR